MGCYEDLITSLFFFRIVLFHIILSVTCCILKWGRGGLQEKVVIICLANFFDQGTLGKTAKGFGVKMTDRCYGYGKKIEITNA